MTTLEIIDIGLVSDNDWYNDVKWSITAGEKYKCLFPEHSGSFSFSTSFRVNSQI